MSDGQGHNGWRGWWERSGESVLGNAGAFIVTYVIACVITVAVVWFAGRFMSIGGGLNIGWKALIALGLTVAFYWYDRNNP